jgi:hypothetical protein
MLPTVVYPGLSLEILSLLRYEKQRILAAPIPLPIDGTGLLFGRRGMPGRGKKNLGEPALRELLRNRLPVGLQVVVTAED